MKPEDINKWMDLVDLSIAERKQKQPNWDLFRDYYRGLQWKDVGEDKEVVTVNMVYAQITVTMPSIYARNPRVHLTPKRPSAVVKAKIGEAVVNQDLGIMDYKTQMKKVLLDTLIYGTGFFKTTYFMEEEEEEPVETNQAEMEGLIAQFRGQPPNLTALGIGKNGPRVLRVSPFDFGWTPGISQLDDTGWVWHHVRKRLDQVKADKYYQNTKDLNPTSMVDEKTRSGITNWNDNTEQAVAMVDLFEFWNVDRGEIFVLAQGHNKPLVSPYEHPYPYEHPFDKLVFSPIPDEVWGMSAIEQIMPQQDELNRLRTLQSSHVKRFGRKYLAIKGAIQDEEQRARLEAGEDGVVVDVDAENVSNAVAPLQDASLPADFYNYSAVIKDDMVEINGVTPYKKGLLRGAKTATEASIAEEHSDVRDNERVDGVADATKKVVKKIIQVRKEFTPTDELIQITEDVSAGPGWELWSKETFDIEADVEIEYGSSMPNNQEAQIQKMSALYDRLATNPTVNPQAMAALLAEAYGVRDVSSLFLPPEIVMQNLVNNQTFGAQKGVSPAGGTGAPPAAGPQKSAPGEEQAKKMGAAKGGQPQLGLVS